MSAPRRQIDKIFVHAAGWFPALWLVWRWVGGTLGADPIRTMTTWTGRSAIAFLLLSLVPGTVRIITGKSRLLAVRRALGLYGFAYATWHLMVYIGLDYGFQWALLWPALRQGPFVLLGAGALLLMLPLAITSTDFWVKRLKRNWSRLHRAAYAAAAFAAWHWIWATKELRPLPVAAGGLLAALLVLRVPPFRKWIAAQRSSRSKAG